MLRKTVVITGGNSGIGKEIAIALAKMDLRVVIVSRNPTKGALALQDIQLASENSTVEMIVGDLGNVTTTIELGDTLLKRYPGLSILINNAGIWPTKKEINSDGLEHSFMVNHLAPFILSNILLDNLKLNAPSRIINVNAALHAKGKVDIEKTPYGHDFNPFLSYANTKLCNILFMLEFSRRNADSGITINAIHPGVIKTNLGSTPGLINSILNLIKSFWGTPREGAKPPVWLATAPELEGVSGNYYDLYREIGLMESAKNQSLATQLWEVSMDLSRLPSMA